MPLWWKSAKEKKEQERIEVYKLKEDAKDERASTRERITAANNDIDNLKRELDALLVGGDNTGARSVARQIAFKQNCINTSRMGLERLESALTTVDSQTSESIANRLESRARKAEIQEHVEIDANESLIEARELQYLRDKRATAKETMDDMANNSQPDDDALTGRALDVFNMAQGRTALLTQDRMPPIPPIPPPDTQICSNAPPAVHVADQPDALLMRLENLRR